MSIELKFSKPCPQALNLILKRSLLLMLLGLSLNAFPHGLQTLRLPGVLQRIAVCYAIVGLLRVYVQPKWLLSLSWLILVLNWWFDLAFPTTAVGHLTHAWSHNSIGYLDQFIFGSTHLLSPNFDPEGLVTTIPALASTIIGLWMAQQLKTHKLLWAGLILLPLAWLWSLTYPLNKALWTSSYILWSAGIGMLLMHLCLAVKKQHQMLYLINYAGQHSLVIFCGHVLGLKILAHAHLWPWPSVSAILFSLSYTMTCLIFFTGLAHLLKFMLK